MNIDKVFSGVFVMAIILGTIGYVWFEEPEQSSVRSTDGVVTVTGLTRESQAFSIDQIDGALPLPLQGTGYSIEPSRTKLDNPAVITFTLTDDEPSEDETIYRLSDTVNMWEAVLPVVSLTASSISVETDTLGTFALGKTQTITAPEFLTTYDELLKKAPKNTVGYVTSVGFNVNIGPTFLVSGVGDSGGCGGLLGTGDGEELSQATRNATVLVNDVQTPVTFVFETRWLTSSAAGCAVDSPLGRSK